MTTSKPTYDELLARVAQLEARLSEHAGGQASADGAAARFFEKDSHTLFEMMLDGFALHEIICDAQDNPVDYRFLAVNPAFEQLTGLAAKDVVRRTVKEILPTIEPHWIQRYGQVALGGQPISFESSTVALHKTFQVKAFRPAPRQFACVFVDITERTHAEEALRESETKLRTLSDNLPGGLVYQIDSGPQGRERRFTYLSAGVESLHGVTVEEAMADAMTIYDQVVEEDRPLVAEKERDAVEKMAPFSAEIRMRPPGGEPRWRILTSAPRRLPNGHLVWDGVEIDITELKRAEAERQQLQAQLVHAQKLEAVGLLAGGISHDFNNLLAAMTLQLDLLRLQTVVRPEELRVAVDELLESTNRAANLTNQLLLFSRRQAMRTSRLDIHAVVANLMTLLGRLLGEQVSLTVDRRGEPRWIEGDVGMIEQVVTNLCVNARDAMPKGGRLTIGIDAVMLDLEIAKRHGAAFPGRWVRMEVSDTGSGMEPEVLEHIFEPFFTTKPQGKGTGLGLATVHGIVATHGGFIEVRSQVGRGSTFTVYLPCAPGEDVLVEQRAPVGLQRGKERILVVEDEAQVRHVVVRCLRGLGYRVADAVNGRHALEVWEEHGGEFDLLFTDMVMPEGLSGLDLCVRLRAARPDLKTIIASGYSAGIIEDENVAMHEVQYLSKPYDVKTLAAAVSEALKPKT